MGKLLTKYYSLPVKNQDTARNIVAKVSTTKKKKRTRADQDETRIVKELKEKTVFYNKADKGNAVPIFDAPTDI